MALQEKYKDLIDQAGQLGVNNLQVSRTGQCALYRW